MFPWVRTATLEGITITGGTAPVPAAASRTTAPCRSSTRSSRVTRPASGGGLSSTGPLSITGGTIEDNSATNGGGVDSVGSLYLANATIEGNYAFTNGGGVAYSELIERQRRQADDHRDHLHREHRASSGGGLYIGSGAVSITGGTLSGNTADGQRGGGLFENGGTLTITGMAITGNSAVASSGGAIFISGGSMTGVGLTLRTTRPRSAVRSPTPDRRRSPRARSPITRPPPPAAASATTALWTFPARPLASNTASGNGLGGGIANSGTFTVEDSTLSKNSASQGGGISNSNGSVTLTNTTIASNTASTGGGVYNGR